MILLEKLKIWTPLPKIAKGGKFGQSNCFHRLWKVAQNPINRPIWSHCPPQKVQLMSFPHSREYRHRCCLLSINRTLPSFPEYQEREKESSFENTNRVYKLPFPGLRHLKRKYLKYIGNKSWSYKDTILGKIIPWSVKAFWLDENFWIANQSR